MPSRLAVKMSEKFAKDLVGVMANLELELIAFMKGVGQSSPATAATILNSRGNFIRALQDSGYNDLASEYVAQFGEVPAAVNKAFAARKLPQPQFSTVAAETFTGLATIDLEAFAAIGQKAMDDLRVGIYKQVIAGDKFQNIVQTIKATTTGVGKNNSPLANYAYTHANTAILDFNNAVTREAGLSIGAEKWEVIGPNDSVTRGVCQEALADPIRTEAGWIAAGYWADRGGWNCRHELVPYFGD